jgi:hypothetical protein
VPGSGREYLAADRLKIYSTVKPSSATNAYPGPDLDGRPKFDVVIIYEDSAAGKRAKHFYDRVIRELVDECDFSLELWNFKVLAVPEIGDSAAKAAAQADLVILSMHRKAQLSVQTRDWIERWSGLITDNNPALVALLAFLRNVFADVQAPNFLERLLFGLGEPLAL